MFLIDTWDKKFSSFGHIDIILLYGIEQEKLANETSSI